MKAEICGAPQTKGESWNIAVDGPDFYRSHQIPNSLFKSVLVL